MDVYDIAIPVIANNIDLQSLSKLQENDNRWKSVDNNRTLLTEQLNVISDNQKVLIFSYIYLFQKISDGDFIDKGKELSLLLNLPQSVFDTCSEMISEERIDYIKHDFKNKGKECYEIFIEPDEYICDLITNIVLVPVKKDKVVLHNLQSFQYEHPTDKKALESLRMNNNIEKVIKAISEYDIERIKTVQMTGSNVRVTEKNVPYLHNALIKVCEILNIKDIPPLYLEQGFINAYTMGMKTPMLVICNSCLSLLSYDELLFLIGHEIGHIKSQHVMYHTIGSYLPVIGNLIGSLTFGIGELISGGLNLALYNWQRKSEFTADRAGLLACQNPDAAVSLMYKLAGFPTKYYENIKTDDFLQQAEQFEDLDSSTYNRVIKMLSIAENDHPWTVMRAKELKKWIDSGEYDNVLNCKNTVSTIDNGNNIATYSCNSCKAIVPSTSKFCPMCGQNLHS